jgi:hypothetical protein
MNETKVRVTKEMSYYKSSGVGSDEESGSSDSEEEI